MLPCFNDVGANTLAYLTALTHLDLSEQDDDYCRGSNPDFNVSDEGARVQASLVRLTFLDLRGFQISDGGVRALCFLTALTHLNLSCVPPLSNEVVGLLCCLPSLASLDLYGDGIYSDEAWGILRNSSISVGGVHRLPYKNSVYHS
jgi:hypothetical protein